MRRTIFTEDHDAFRESVRVFIAAEATPFVHEWDAAETIPPAFWRRAAQQGMIGFEIPERFGGPELDDFRFNAIVAEELARGNAPGDNFQLQSDIVAAYLCDLATEEQKSRWLPPFAAGELTFAICMTEPGAGSDLRALTTKARRVDGGYRLNGTKTFVTAGIQAGVAIVAAQLTDATGQPEGLTLLCVEEGTEGFTRGRKLDKIGCRAQDTAELFFDDVLVPEGNRLGDEGRGLAHLKRHLSRERLSIAVTATAAAEHALAMTITYCGERHTFGQPIARHQGVRWYLAEMQTEVDLARVYVDRCLQALHDSELTAEEAARAKFWCSEMEARVVDRCLQLHGGYGYIEEYPIARLWRNSRLHRIYGGTSEIMKDIIGAPLTRAA
jgi:alkylation response protein AidB-like acyl-CoA dehydrogenase